MLRVFGLISLLFYGIIMLKNCGDRGVRMRDTVFINDRDVDHHTLLKVAQSNFQLGTSRSTAWLTVMW